MSAPPFEWGDVLPTLAARRVSLRWLSEDDSAAIFAIFGDPEVMRYWSSPPLRDLAAARQLIAEIHHHFHARDLFQWGVALQPTGEIVGTCTLHAFSAEHRRAELGFALARACWGQGLANEILQTIIPFAFRTLGLHRLEADVDPANSRSLRLLEAHGFSREWHLRERWHHLGEMRDTLYLGLLSREWAARGASNGPPPAAQRPDLC